MYISTCRLYMQLRRVFIFFFPVNPRWGHLQIHFSLTYIYIYFFKFLFLSARRAFASAGEQQEEEAHRREWEHPESTDRQIKTQRWRFLNRFFSRIYIYMCARGFPSVSAVQMRFFFFLTFKRGGGRSCAKEAMGQKRTCLQQRTLA